MNNGTSHSLAFFFFFLIDVFSCEWVQEQQREESSKLPPPLTSCMYATCVTDDFFFLIPWSPKLFLGSQQQSFHILILIRPRNFLMSLSYLSHHIYISFVISSSYWMMCHLFFFVTLSVSIHVFSLFNFILYCYHIQFHCLTVRPCSYFYNISILCHSLSNTCPQSHLCFC